ncbi:MAG: TlpA family protein disulfide reductase, partial [Odoribacter splanchnicus]
MKEIIVLILVLVSLFSCSKSDVVQVSGRIENGDSIVSILVDDSIYTLSLDQQGFFSGKIDMVKGGYATMLHNALNLYLSPGEDLEIYVNAKNFSGSLYFRGSLGGINSYLKEQEIAVFFDKDYYALNEEEFVQKMRALIDEKVKLLEAKNFDDSFTELEKQRIGYSIAVRASLYPSFRRNMYPDEDYRPGSVFSDFLSSFSINNERLIGAKDYRDFLLNYVYIQGSRGAQGWENYSDGIADYILATVNSPTIKSFLLTQLVYNYICENNGIEGADYLLSVFHQECTDPNKIAYIDGMVEL